MGRPRRQQNNADSLPEFINPQPPAHFRNCGYDHGTVLGPNAAFTGFRSVATVTNPTAGEFINFNSADLTAAWIPGFADPS
jgi:hypothetical protein